MRFLSRGPNDNRGEGFLAREPNVWVRVGRAVCGEARGQWEPRGSAGVVAMPRARRLPAVLVVTAIVVAAAACGTATNSDHGDGAAAIRDAVRRAVLVSQTVVPVPSTIDYTG